MEPATDQERIRLDAQIRAIRRFDKIPPGTQLVVDRATRRQLVLTIESIPDWMSPPPDVTVRDQLRDPHPAVAMLSEAARLLPVAGPPRRRALPLLQALVVASTSRGHSVSAPADRPDIYGRYERRPPTLRFRVRGHDIDLRVTQENDRTAHVPTAKELAHKERYSWTRISEYDCAPSARLKFELPGPHEQRQSIWSDTGKSQLETRLAQILQEMEMRSVAAERAAIAAEERRKQAQLQEEARIARVKIEQREKNRAEILQAQATAWRTARQLEAYLAAMEAKIGQLADASQVNAAREWLDWARAHMKQSTRCSVGSRCHPTRSTDRAATSEARRPWPSFVVRGSASRSGLSVRNDGGGDEGKVAGRPFVGGVAFPTGQQVAGFTIDVWPLRSPHYPGFILAVIRSRHDDDRQQLNLPHWAEPLVT